METRAILPMPTYFLTCQSMCVCGDHYGPIQHSGSKTNMASSLTHYSLFTISLHKLKVGINWNARPVPRGHSTELNSWSTLGRKNGYLVSVVERVG